MSAAFWPVLLGMAFAQGPQTDWQRFLEEGRFGASWEALSRELDALGRARGKAAVLYRAGDPAGALGSAESGLEQAPEDLELLRRAVLASIWLRDAGRARGWLQRLERIVSTAELASEDRDSWKEAARGFGARIVELERAENERSRAVARARLVAGAVLFLSAGALGFLLRALRADPEARSGTKDR